MEYFFSKTSTYPEYILNYTVPAGIVHHTKHIPVPFQKYFIYHERNARQKINRHQGRFESCVLGGISEKPQAVSISRPVRFIRVRTR